MLTYRKVNHWKNQWLFEPRSSLGSTYPGNRAIDPFYVLDVRNQDTAVECRVDLEKDSKNKYRKKDEGKTNESNERSNEAGKPGETTKKRACFSFLRSFKATTLAGKVIIDSGASDHMTGNREWFTTLKEITPVRIEIANGTVAAQAGNIDILVSTNEKEWTPMTWEGVLYVPELGTVSLMSMGRLTDRGYTIFSSKKLMKVCKGITIFCARRSEGQFIALLKVVYPKRVAALAATTKSIGLWHKRLGHVSDEVIRVMSTNGLANDLQVKIGTRPVCDECFLGKQTASSHQSKTTERTFKPGESIHSDVLALPTKSWDGCRLVVVFKCENSAYRIVCCLKSKDMVPEVFELVVQRIKRETGNDVLTFRSENGTEFINEKMRTIVEKYKIKHERSPPHVKQCNGMAERENRTLMDTCRTLLIGAELEKDLRNRLWSEAIRTAAYLRNRVPNRGRTDVTPYELWFKKKPEVSHLRIFGSKAFVHIPDHQRRKLDPKSKKCIFVGYDWDTNKIYRIYDPETQTVKRVSNTVVIDCEATEESTTLLDEGSTQEGIAVPEEDVNEVQCEDPEHSESEIREKVPNTAQVEEERVYISEEELSAERDWFSRTSQIQEEEERVYIPEEENEYIPGTSHRRTSSPKPSHPRNRGRPKNSKTGVKWKNYYRENPDRMRETRQKDSGRKIAMISIRQESQDPTSYSEAAKRPDACNWYKAMDSEMYSLISHQVWSLCPLPEGKQAISGRWIFKTKTDTEGNITKYKARFVARGYSQIEGLDFTETFAPVVRKETVRALLALAALQDYDIKQFDITTAFLYGDLTEEIYVEQPEGYEDGKDRVCRLHKGLYGLKQAPRQWNGKFHKFLIENGFSQSKEDPCLYHTLKYGIVLIICLYVDDGLLFSTDGFARDKFIRELSSEFKVTVTEPDNYIGMQITRNRENHTIRISQTTYIQKVLQRFGMIDAKPMITPSEPSFKLTKREETGKEEVTQEPRFPYREAIGCLNYIAGTTRPDISYAVNRAARYCNDPGQAHWLAVKRILRYLKGTINYTIIYNTGKYDQLTGYCDSDFAGDTDTSKSTSGYVFLFHGGPISWSSKLQTVTAISTTEAEYMSLSNATKECIWLRELLQGLGIKLETTVLHIDNQGAKGLAENPICHQRSKHIRTKFHRIREEIELGTVRLEFVETNNQAADCLTKSLTGQFMNRARDLIGLTDCE